MKKCIVNGCNNECELNRRYCHRHYLDRRIELYKTKKEKGLKYRSVFIKTCIICGKQYKTFNKNISKYCNSCFKKINIYGHNTNNNYLQSKGVLEHRRIAENILGRKLHKDEVIHHLDENPKNNSLDNLLLLNRSTHSKLHRFLQVQRVIMEESMNENVENCWDNLIVPMTTTWLETANVNVIKLSEIGQSAAESLKTNKSM